jgi:hypothetical protein
MRVLAVANFRLAGALNSVADGAFLKEVLLADAGILRCRGEWILPFRGVARNCGVQHVSGNPNFERRRLLARGSG